MSAFQNLWPSFSSNFSPNFLLIPSLLILDIRNPGDLKSWRFLRRHFLFKICYSIDFINIKIYLVLFWRIYCKDKRRKEEIILSRVGDFQGSNISACKKLIWREKNSAPKKLIWKQHFLIKHATFTTKKPVSKDSDQCTSEQPTRVQNYWKSH